jgi:hypothetical protein
MLDKILEISIKTFAIILGIFSTIGFIIDTTKNFSIQLIGLYLLSIIIMILIYKSSDIANP